MTVWILTGEYALTENGESFWIEGIYKTRAAAIAAATLTAGSEEYAGRKVLVDRCFPEIEAEKIAAAWTEEEVEEDDTTDWEVCFDVAEHEVHS